MDLELEAWLRRVAQSVLGEYPTLVATFELAKSVMNREIPGDFVECGVYAGAEVAVMAKAIVLNGCTVRKVHLFDSFMGVPAAGPEDLEFLKENVQPGGANCPIEGVRKNMRDWGVPDEKLVYHPGWFADTVPISNIGQIALLRLDGDLYESTKVCMEHLYPKVSVGGWVIVDDYPLSGCRKALHEVLLPQPIYFQKVA